jgi:hypothetical protein
LLVLTACRRTALSWPEVDLERRLIELPGERVKNGMDYLVPLSELALSILQDTPHGRRQEGCYIFGQERSAEGFAGWTKDKIALDKRIAKARGGRPLAAWRPRCPSAQPGDRGMGAIMRDRAANWAISKILKVER